MAANSYGFSFGDPTTPGTYNISDGTITITGFLNQQSMVIDITDSGKGMDPKAVDRVFETGFTTKKRGWGIGLALTKRIIEQYHKGKISIRWTEPGKGSCFRIELPILSKV